MHHPTHMHHPAHRNDLSVVDIMYVPTLERLGANLPQARNMDIRTNPNYPRLAAWFAALDALPAYAKVCVFVCVFLGMSV